MCLAFPGRIISINGDTALIEYPGQTREAKLIESGFSVGDFVFVQSGIVVQKLSSEEALKSLKAWKGL